ncbi:DUF2948 family protein [Blastochloris viridis]|uniref:DUF2948 family protein n=1 Tax=Blastochloris viridis TaxID=1079 RepID=A0A0H5BD02_BLAVI|nr:DUF2948 family protein [Blastochloris viridis]ALK08532.1 hypothetical protein BVIR_738 [Blastochloris viridis]BAR98181.1 hypothetical protein BV133_588 [Blastochloris viridis]CUU41195.1 hypothetical protein BVIRIDIS_01830 [Blastochloris viridis]
MVDLLKLAALDADDLETISAHLQDATVTVGDMAYLPHERRFAMVVNRFDWLAANNARPEYRRRRSGLQIHRVLRAATHGFSPCDSDRVLNLLAITFTPGAAPSGTVTLVFSADAAIRLEVECIEAAVSDLGPVWSTEALPTHEEIACGASAVSHKARAG